jgi:hypothetical protein
MHAETLRESAVAGDGYGGQGGWLNYRLQDIQWLLFDMAALNAPQKIVWDDPDFARFAS